ncbi:MAG: hypothetical protein A2X36_05070 [Elusimicrobia bacterium GWA2_69_24]|nr:MAG: hypothetical protein A2X52_15395 [Candidatus Rokubacteria bacterium GWC2_70_16]OGK89593.1 MAG: hypothetical protein A2W08_17470 [Candidatus Rokubacteria bacterium RBG_16_73_20]OGR61027.1 MAG: hypothetical protein A2X36_05070 [Elusimicrobia bacterium GWA2_69_24]HBH04890.1 hypothetical protein [Candidatus Rokubacteria bacterium]
MRGPVTPRRVLAVLSHSLHIRNFVASGLLDLLRARGHRLTAVVPAAFVARVAADLGGEGAVSVEPLEPHVGGRVRQRVRAVLRTASYVRREALSTYRHKLAVRTRTVRGALEVRLLRALGRLGDLEAMARAAEAAIPVQRSAVALIRRTAPDTVLIPTFIHDALDVEIAKAARAAGVPVVGCPVSWDTLTSKGFFLVVPDELAVWGEDTLRHAVEYHGVAPERVAVTGPPHFDIYGPTWEAPGRARFLAARGIDPETRVILFAGTTVTYWADEPLQLRALSGAIGRGELGRCLVWYRPHPRRSYRDVSELAGLPGVWIDDQIMRQKVSSASSYSVEREDLAHYRGLIDACDGVVTSFSTLIIEAALMGKPSLVVAYGLGDQTPDRLLQHSEYEHMRDVISTPGVTLCRSLPETLEGLRRIVRGDFAPYAEVLRKRASEIAHCLDGRARERLVEVIERSAARRGPGV